MGACRTFASLATPHPAFGHLPRRAGKVATGKPLAPLTSSPTSPKIPPGTPLAPLSREAPGPALAVGDCIEMAQARLRASVATALPRRASPPRVVRERHKVPGPLRTFAPIGFGYFAAFADVVCIFAAACCADLISRFSLSGYLPHPASVAAVGDSSRVLRRRRRRPARRIQSAILSASPGPDLARFRVVGAGLDGDPDARLRDREIAGFFARCDGDLRYARLPEPAFEPPRMVDLAAFVAAHRRGGAAPAGDRRLRGPPARDRRRQTRFRHPRWSSSR